MIEIKMNIRKTSMIEKIFIVYVITSYIGLLYLDVYNPVVLIGVLGLVFFSLYLIIEKNQPIDKFILMLACYHLIPCLLAENLLDIVYLLAYITLIISIGLFISYMKERSMEIISKIVMVISLFNFIYILYQPFEITRTKVILGLSINLRMSKNVVFSRTAIVALIAFVLFYKLKTINLREKIIKIMGIIMNLFTIMFLGKLSTLFTLFIVICIGELIKLIRNKSLNKVISLIIPTFTFFLAFIMPYIVDLCIKNNINYKLLFSGREELWIKYINYFKEVNIIDKLFGSIYIRTINEIGGEMIKHPHNQYLTILVSSGVVGLILYIILFYKAYYNSLHLKDIRGFMILLSVNLIGITDDYIFLTVIIIDSFYYIYYCTLKNKKYM